MNWRSLILALWPDAEVAAPAKPDEVSAVEAKLEHAIPDDIREFLLQVDGALVDSGMMCLLGVRSNESLLSVHAELKTTPEYRQLYQSFDGLFFFASDGMGGYFGRVADLAGFTDQVIHWEHDDDSREDYSEGGLEGFLRRYHEVGCP